MLGYDQEYVNPIVLSLDKYELTLFSEFCLQMFRSAQEHYLSFLNMYRSLLSYC